MRLLFLSLILAIAANAAQNSQIIRAQSPLNLTAGVMSLPDGSVANAKLATMATARMKGNVSGSTASPSDLTATQVTAFLNNLIGDSGSGGTKGLCPAPAAGDAAAGKFLKADGTWAVPASSGGITGPGTTVANNIVTWNSTTGAVVKDSGVPLIEGLLNGASGTNFSLLMGRGSSNITPNASGNIVAIVEGATASSTTSAGNTLIGTTQGSQLRNSSGGQNVAIGNFTPAALGTVAVGSTFVGSLVGNFTGNVNTASSTGIGYLAFSNATNANYSTVLGAQDGSGSFVAQSHVICIGAFCEGTIPAGSGSSTLVVGGYSSVLDVGGVADGYFGRGIQTPLAKIGSGFTFHPTEPTGTNVSAAAAPIRVAGGRGRGTGAGSDVILAIAPAGSSGANQNLLVDSVVLKGDGTGFKADSVWLTQSTLPTNNTATGTVNIDWSTGAYQKVVLTGTVTFTMSGQRPGAVEYTLAVSQDATGSRTVTWPATVKWPANTAPTLTTTANRTDIFRFKWDGSNFAGSIYGQDFH